MHTHLLFSSEKWQLIHLKVFINPHFKILLIIRQQKHLYSEIALKNTKGSVLTLFIVIVMVLTIITTINCSSSICYNDFLYHEWMMKLGKPYSKTAQKGNIWLMLLASEFDTCCQYE